MMSSQLGRIVLGGSTASEDAMRSAPDPEGGYGVIDEIVAAASHDGLSPSTGRLNNPLHLGLVEAAHGGGAHVP